jgi:hypothetical protein
MIYFLLLFLIFSLNAWAMEDVGVKKSILELASSADFKCFDLKFLGFCPKPNRQPPIGLKVRYWQPEVFMETVKMPGGYVIQEYGAVLHSLAQNVAKIEMELATGIKPLTVTSGSSSSSLTGSNMQFNEVHLYDFPLSSILDTALCSEVTNKTLGVRYLSEIDSKSWRTGDIEKNLPQSLAAPIIGSRCSVLPLGAEGQCMKTWGPLYPREGFVITPSEPVGSVIDAMRSISIASNSVPIHIVESKLNFSPNLSIDKVQMVYPSKTSCFSIGQNPYLWEQGKRSKEGNYVWIFWHQRQCCV